LPMNSENLQKLLEDVRAGAVSVADAMERIKHLPFEDLGYARVDSHRGLRCGFPEVVFCLGKTVDQIIAILERLVRDGSPVLATRADPEVYAAIAKKWPGAGYNEQARAITFNSPPEPRYDGYILVVTGGTSDIPVAEEAKVTAEMMGNRVKTVYDAGVAGIHRLLHCQDAIFDANVIVVVAGMEGALASVIGGLSSRPVIAVPTSVGYGASFGGLAPLLTMLNSCAAGVSVVNIDNGFGAGYIAALVNRPVEEKK
jgi:NCAIR mutase (PurE)-related protein